ncbi:MAG: hypothetical protein H0V66_06210 [Bdellovibrionales bacterium]|nr:hypothetical protein [Bdellovibrionales bacterium]
MKLLSTTHSHSRPFQHHDYSSRKPTFTKRAKKDEFKKVLENFLIEQPEEGEEFRVLLPQHGHFWDNGYEDV